MYLMIENDGVSSVDCWVKMGLSSTRQNDDPRLIGKFGSGVKHGIMTLLRNGISPIIYLGENQLQVSTEKKSAKTLDGEMNHFLD